MEESCCISMLLRLILLVEYIILVKFWLCIGKIRVPESRLHFGRHLLIVKVSSRFSVGLLN